MQKLLELSIPLTLLALLTIARPASAQEVTRMPDDARHSLGLEAGLESAFFARATYNHRLDLGALEDPRLFARFTMPVVAPDFGDWGIDLGMRATPLSYRNLRAAVLVGPLLRHAENDLFAATAIGVEGTLLLGYEGRRWGLSAELGYQQMLTTYLRHSDLYRHVSYAEAKDGWYAITGSTAHAGLRGGVRFGSVEIAARAGLDATGEFHQTMPPFYVSLGGAYAF